MSSDELPPPGGNTDGGVTPPPAGSLVVNPEGPRAYILEDRNDDHTFDPGIDDLTGPIRKTLGDYLSHQTLHGTETYGTTHGNAIAVPPGDNTFKFAGPEGYPVDIVTGQAGNDSHPMDFPVFTEIVKVNGAGSAPPLSETSGPTFTDLEGGETLGKYLSKGGQPDLDS